MTPQACADAGADYPAYEVFVGVDVGKSFHAAFARDAAGRRLASGGAGSLEAATGAFLARALERGGADPSRVLVVVGRRRNIGTTVIRRALAAGCEVAYITGKREKRARELFPGVAKSDAKDAEVIAAAAAGMPRPLLPVPREDDGLEGARRLRSQLSFAARQRAQCKNRLRSALVESNGAFERLAGPGRAWTLDVLERIGGPWQILGAGRERLAEVARGARAREPGALWESLSLATRPTEEQVRSEAATFRILARQTRSLRADADELSEMAAREVEGDETYRCLLTVPGVGPATAAQLVAGVRIEAFPGNDGPAGHCGLAPKDTQSGTAPSSATSSPEGNRCLKNLPMFACLSLVGSDGEFGRHCRACRARGMRHAAALKATARKRLKAVCAVMRDRRPYAPPA